MNTHDDPSGCGQNLAYLDPENREIALNGPDGDNALSEEEAAAIWQCFRDAAPEMIARREYLERRALDELPRTLWDWYIRRCSRLSTRLHNVALRAHTRPSILLRSTQFAVLAVVRSTPPGEKLHEVARRAGIHRTTLSRSLARLERLGLVRREIVSRDRRRHPVTLTEAGELAIHLNLRPMQQAQVEIGAYVKDGFDGMDKMRDGLKRHFFAVRRALYQDKYDLRPEMYDDTPRGHPSYYADSTVRAQRR